MKKSVLAVFLFGLSASMAAIAAGEIRIGVVDINKILLEAPQADAAGKSIKAEFSRRNRDLVAKQKKLRKLEEKLSRDGAIMSAAEVRRLEQDIRTQQRKLKAATDEYREDLNLRKNEELVKVGKTVTEVVHQLGKDENIDLILSEGVVYASPRVNLTEKVLSRLKKQFKGSKK